MIIALTSTVVATKDQISTEMSDETVILNLQDGVYYGLDPVGTFIWKNIQEPVTVQKVHDAILSEYAVDPALAQADLINLLTKLHEHNLIQIS